MIKKILLLLLFTAILYSCSEQKVVEQEEVVPIKVQTLVSSPIETIEASTFTGKVHPIKAVDLSTKILGRIVQLKVEEGDEVKKGELLVQVDNSELEAKKRAILANLKQAEASFINSEKDFSRIKSLYEKESATEKELDDITYQLESSRASVNSLKASLKELEELLEYSYIKAPFDGVVVQKFQQAGNLAEPGVPILSLESKNTYKVVMKIPEQDLKYITLGKSVFVYFTGKNTPITGEISAVNPSSTAGNSQFEATVLFPKNEIVEIKSGFFAEVVVNKSISKKIMIDKNHLVYKGQLRGVYTINNQDKVNLRWLRLGKEINGKVEVVSGLSEKEAYIISSTQKISGGEKVTVSN